MNDTIDLNLKYGNCPIKSVLVVCTTFPSFTWILYVKNKFSSVKLSEKLIDAHGLVKFWLKHGLIVYNCNQSG